MYSTCHSLLCLCSCGSASPDRRLHIQTDHSFWHVFSSGLIPQNGADGGDNGGNKRLAETPTEAFNRRRLFEQKINDIKATFIRRTMEADSLVASSSHLGPCNGLYLVHELHGGLASNMEKYRMKLTFHEAADHSGYLKMTGKGMSYTHDARILHLVTQGLVARATGEAYWITETHLGIRVASQGTFDFANNSFTGRSTSDCGRKGTYARFELVEATTAETTTEDIERLPVAQVVGIIEQEQLDYVEAIPEIVERASLEKVSLVARAVPSSSDGDGDQQKKKKVFSLLGPSDLLRRSDQFHAAVDKA